VQIIVNSEKSLEFRVEGKGKMHEAWGRQEAQGMMHKARSNHPAQYEWKIRLAALQIILNFTACG
jgi:hypothetical protein